MLIKNRFTFRTKVDFWFAQRGMDPRDLFRLVAFFICPYSKPNRRLPFREMVRAWLKEPIPDHAYPFLLLGGIAFFLLLVQVLTGTLLAVYYRSAPNEAYASVQHVVTSVHLGWLIRQLHAWGANLLILVAFIYLIMVFLRKAYTPPRELHWMTAVLLLFLMLCFGFTGHLLPWDNAAYWSTAVGTEVLGRMPMAGKFLLLFLRGELSVGGATLSRFYAFHVTILPWMCLFLIAAWFLIARRLVSAPPDRSSMRREGKARPFYPDFLFLAGIVLYLITGLLLTLAILAPIPLGDRADILSTPAGIKPPWYFLGAFQFVRYLPASVGVTLLLLGCLALLLWPFIARMLVQRSLNRRVPLGIGIAVLAFLILFTVLGSLAESRIRLGGSSYQFDTRAIPHRVK